MADLFSGATTLLSDSLKANAGKTATYSRGGMSASLTVTMQTPVFEDDTDFGRITSEIKDFIIQADDLIIGGLTVQPERGDTITVSINSEDRVYEVVGLQGEPPWRYSDPYNVMIRVHATRVRVRS